MDEPQATTRQQIKEFITEGPKSLRDISQELRISEKEALDHLEHIAKARGQFKLRVVPAECLGCGYVFIKREKLGKPGKCPVCKGGHISQPMYGME